MIELMRMPQELIPAKTITVCPFATGPGSVSCTVWPVLAAFEVPRSATNWMPAAWLKTVTVTGAEVVVFPALSRATAVSVCVPFADFVVSQVALYGAAVLSAPSGWPSRRSCTPATPTLSLALAVTVTDVATVCPGAGLLIATVGGLVSASTLTVASLDSGPALPAPSTAVTA